MPGSFGFCLKVWRTPAMEYAGSGALERAYAGGSSEILRYGQVPGICNILASKWENVLALLGSSPRLTTAINPQVSLRATDLCNPLDNALDRRVSAFLYVPQACGLGTAIYSPSQIASNAHSFLVLEASQGASY